MCNTCIEHLNKRIEFVTQCGELLKKAKPHLLKCELVLGKSISTKYEHCIPDDEYVIVTCENGCTYRLCVEGNSLIAIANEIFNSMTHK